MRSIWSTKQRSDFTAACCSSFVFVSTPLTPPLQGRRSLSSSRRSSPWRVLSSHPSYSLIGRHLLATAEKTQKKLGVTHWLHTRSFTRVFLHKPSSGRRLLTTTAWGRSEIKPDTLRCAWLFKLPLSYYVIGRHLQATAEKTNQSLDRPISSTKRVYSSTSVSPLQVVVFDHHRLRQKFNENQRHINCAWSMLSLSLRY